MCVLSVVDGGLGEDICSPGYMRVIGGGNGLVIVARCYRGDAAWWWLVVRCGEERRTVVVVVGWEMGGGRWAERPRR